MVFWDEITYRDWYEERLDSWFVITDASIHDSQMMADLLHEEESIVYGDKAYVDVGEKLEYEGDGIAWCINRKGKKGCLVSQEDQERNHEQNWIPAKGEHAFRIVKHLWKYQKVRYKGLKKNAAQVFTLFALANLYMVRKELLQMEG